jgi:hypothetical protein
VQAFAAVFRYESLERVAPQSLTPRVASG